MTTITDLKRIDHVIDRSDDRPQSEYWGYYDGNFIGIKSTSLACEKMLDDYAYDLLSGDLCIPATALDGVCGDCGQALDSMGLCGCRDDEPTPEQQAQRDGVLQEYQDDQARYRDAEADEPEPWAAPLNTDDTQLAAAWRAYKAGAMLWTDVQAIQAGLMPRCADHDRPAAILLNKRPACPQCMEETEPVAA